MKKMEIAYVTVPELDITNWSGLDYFIAKSLEQECHLDYIDGLKTGKNFSHILKKIIAVAQNKRYNEERSASYGINLANQVSARLKPSSDIVFSPSSITIAHLNTNKPKAFYTDATYASMVKYYDSFSGLSPLTIKEGYRQEKLALDTCNMAFYSSDWAAQSAVANYGINPEKVKVVPFGANINVKMNLSDVKSMIRQRSSQKCSILFLGVDWYRKGGDIVFDAVKYLNEELHLPTELNIVGIDNLPIENLPPYVINHGRISKGTPEGLKRIEDMISQSHFLFVPSRAEAYGLVFCESMAFGVPCISANTGGIPTIVKNDVNGVLLEPGTQPQKYAEKIYEVYTNKQRYEEMSLSAFNDFETRLNWDVAGKTLVKYLKEL